MCSHHENARDSWQPGEVQYVSGPRRTRCRVGLLLWRQGGSDSRSGGDETGLAASQVGHLDGLLPSDGFEHDHQVAARGLAEDTFVS